MISIVLKILTKNETFYVTLKVLLIPKYFQILRQLKLNFNTKYYHIVVKKRVISDFDCSVIYKFLIIYIFTYSKYKFKDLLNSVVRFGQIAQIIQNLQTNCSMYSKWPPRQDPSFNYSPFDMAKRYGLVHRLQNK